MTNRFGYVVAFDGFDQLWYVEDSHGAVIHGPFGSAVAAGDWIAEWVDMMDRLREKVRGQEKAERERLNEVMRELYRDHGVVAVPDTL